jgi:aspartate/methionine/tyrosine aminotransferase
LNFETYPFEKLSNLLSGIEPNEEYTPLTLTIGEPQLQTPLFIQDELCNSRHLLNKYPKSSGEQLLKESMKGFVKRRFNIELKDTQIIPTFGTREVLFNLPQYLLFDKKDPSIAFTNPFYQIYEGAAIASRAKIYHLNLTKNNNFKILPDNVKDILKDTDLVIVNFPNNPTSSSLSLDELTLWVEASMEYGFILINDECYSELYYNSGDNSLLEASVQAGNKSFKNILVVNSISKRSSAPGLRSGFVAGDEDILNGYMKYRTYVGAASPLPLQLAASRAWGDEEHVKQIRSIYRDNFDMAKDILGITPPKSTFYLWLEVFDDKKFTKLLFKEKNLKVLPGSFLSRGKISDNYVRIALVESQDKTRDALLRIKDILGN